MGTAWVGCGCLWLLIKLGWFVLLLSGQAAWARSLGWLWLVVVVDSVELVVVLLLSRRAAWVGCGWLWLIVIVD